MRDFKELKVWHKAHRCALEIYRHTQNFPVEERFGLIVQLRRAATSVASNIAEGCGREGERELARFLSIAAGSASEVEYHLLLARDLSLVNDPHYQQINQDVVEVKRMLTALIQKLKADS